MRSVEFGGNERFNFLLPLGATEQHGPYAPFGTDTFILEHLIDRIESQFPDLILLPTIPYSLSEDHRDFFGTIYVSEDTMTGMLHDVCQSICARADILYITSFHFISDFLDQFIDENAEKYAPAKLIHLEPSMQEDDAIIEQMLDGPIDEHAGNTEISNMLVIDPALVRIPTDHLEKMYIENPFGTGNLADKSRNGIADNHPQWIVNMDIGLKSLAVYFARMKETIAFHNASV